MWWLIIAVIFLFLFALIGIIEGISIKKYFKDGRIYLFYTTFLQGALSCLVIFFKPIAFEGYSFLAISILAGFFFVYGLIPYMKSLEFEEVSRVNPLFNLGPIFVLILSIIFLGLRLAWVQYMGFGLLLAGGFLISTKKFKGLFKISRGFWYMMLTNLLLGFYFIITDYLFKRHDYWSTFVFIQFGILLASLSLILIKDYGKQGILDLKKWKKGAILLVIGASVLSIIAVAVRNLAISLSSATIITSLGGIQSFFVLVMTLFISWKFTKVLKEEISREIIFLKIISIILLILGIYFVTI